MHQMVSSHVPFGGFAPIHHISPASRQDDRDRTVVMVEGGSHERSPPLVVFWRKCVDSRDRPHEPGGVIKVASIGYHILVWSFPVRKSDIPHIRYIVCIGYLLSYVVPSPSFHGIILPCII